MEIGFVKIGKSKGICIPKPILEQCGFKKMVNIEVRDRTLLIKPVRKHRKGWDKAFKLMHKNIDDRLLDSDTIASKFDQIEWTW